jgi:hypothetical protein
MITHFWWFIHETMSINKCCWWLQISSIPKISPTGELNYSFAIYIISYFVVVNWTLLQVAVAGISPLPLSFGPTLYTLLLHWSFCLPKQVTVAILLNSFVGAITAAEEENTQSSASSTKSREMLRYAVDTSNATILAKPVFSHKQPLHICVSRQTQQQGALMTS